MACRSARSRSQIACNASAVALSRRLSGKAVEPGGVLRLQCGELGDGVVPALRLSAMVGGAAGADHRDVGRPRGAVAGLVTGLDPGIGVGHGFLADRWAGHGCTPKRYVTKPEAASAAGRSTQGVPRATTVLANTSSLRAHATSALLWQWPRATSRA